MVVACAQAQTAKEVGQITEQHSLQSTRNLLRIAIFNITYIRGLFPEEYFRDMSVQALVSFSYSKTSEEISMEVGKDGRHRKTLKTSATELNYDQMRRSACKMVRTLVALMRTLNGVPTERTILMKLYYYDDVTPVDYEPPFFRCCTYDEKRTWRQPPFRMKTGEVNSNYITLSLKVKSALDPCDDEIDENSTGVASSRDSETSCETLDSDGKDKIEKKGDEEEADSTSKVNEHYDDDDEITQDSEHETANFEKIKQWLLSRTTSSGNFQIADVLANFPEISTVHIEELLNRMVKESILTHIRKDHFRINRQVDYDEAENRQQINDRSGACRNTVLDDDNTIYMKALYHALPLQYITISQLQNKLGAEVNQAGTRKLIEKMVVDGYIEGTPANRKMGRRVIQSEQARKKLQEVEEALKPLRSQDETANEGRRMLQDKPSGISSVENRKQKKLPEGGFTPEGTKENGVKIQAETPAAGASAKVRKSDIPEDLDTSTYGGLHSLGSDLTRHGLHDDLNPLVRTSNGGKPGSSPAGPKVYMNKRALSRESQLNRNINELGCSPPQKSRSLSKRGTELHDSQETWEKDVLPRKASMVEEPIYQSGKRLRGDTK